MIDGPDDITADWLAHALRAPVQAVTVEQIGTGQTGASFRLRLDAGDELPPTLVAKTAAGDRPQRERVGPGYRNEVGFYTVFRDRVQIRTPRCWHAEISDDNCSFVLLLDDLAPARPGVQVDGCTVDQAGDALRNLAGLHAPVWNDPTLSGDQLLSTFGTQLKDAKAPPAYPTWEQVAAVFDTEVEKLAKSGEDPAAVAKTVQTKASSIGTGA